MRSISFVPVLLLAACGATNTAPGDAGSVRERLGRGETTLAISAESTGTINAARKSDGMWVAGVTELQITAGELALAGRDDSTVTIEALAIEIGPLALPEELLGYPVGLTDIRIGLVDPVKVLVDWESDDQGYGTASLDLLLEWSLSHHDTTSPLGSPDLPRVPVELSLVGDGSTVHAELSVAAPGELYSWASLMKLEDLNLALASDTP